MEPDRWNRIQRLFGEALAVAPEARASWLRQACGDDAELLHEVQALLAHDAASQRTLEQVVQSEADAVLAQFKLQRQGERFGPWEIVEHIADGGMGAVYRARRADGAFEQVAALKLLSPALLSEQGRRRLEAERQILAGLNHPHIARLLDGGSSAEGVPYLVMEYVDGEPIDDYCNAQGLDTSARLRLFLRVCEAVDYAHRNLVVHRDLKPSNLLVSTDGTPKLLDFGISKLLDATDPALTAADQRLFTPAHASPEQVSGGPITTATDVYALGVLLYELLSGSLPFAAAGRTSAQIAQDILQTEPARPSVSVARSSKRLEAARRRGEALTEERLRRELDGDLDNIVLMALRKEPARRYASVQALADDVRAVLDHRPVAARADTFAYRTAKFVRRHRAGVAAGVMVLVASAGMLAYHTERLEDERDRAVAADERSSQTAAFLAGLLESTEADRGTSRDTTVQDLLDRAAEQIDNELAVQPEVASKLRLALGRAYFTWGSHQQAQTQYLKALEIERARGEPSEEIGVLLRAMHAAVHNAGDLQAALSWAEQAVTQWRALDDPAELGEALAAYGGALRHVRRADDAVAAFEEGIALLRSAPPERRASLAFELNTYGWLLQTQGRYREALPLYEEAAELMRTQHHPPIERFQVIKNLGGLHYEMGDFDRAQSIWRDAAAILDETYGADAEHEAVANMRMLLAIVPIERGQFEEAEQFALQGLRINQRVLGSEHRRTFSAQDAVARVKMGQGKLQQAEALVRQSLQGRRQRLPAQHVEIARSHVLLGQVLMLQSRLAEAEDQLRLAKEMLDRADIGDSARLDTTLLLLGQVVADQGRVEEGAASLRRGIERQQKRLSSDHWMVRTSAALLLTPPFVTPEQATASDELQAVRDDLRSRLGESAPRLTSIERRLRPYAAVGRR